MNRRTFFTTVLGAVGALSVSRLFKSELAFAAPAKKAKMKPLKATAAEFFAPKDVTTVQQFCDTTGNKKACPAHKAGQHCAKCQFFVAKGSYKGKVAGQCQLIPQNGKKQYIYGSDWCQSFVPKQS